MTRSPHTEDSGALSIRLAGPEDARTLARLAALDSRKLPRGAVLLAEIDGVPAAAIGLGDGRLVANPFQSTAEISALLRTRRDELNQTGGPSDGRRRWRPTRGLRLRARRARS
jgi:hypothetical protein